MAHDHRHETGLQAGSQSRPIAITLGLVVLYMGLEVVGGIVSGSLALLADAGHHVTCAEPAKRDDVLQSAQSVLPNASEFGIPRFRSIAIRRATVWRMPCPDLSIAAD